MAVVVRSAGVTELVARDAELTQVATGFQFTEGPVWHPREGVLYFSDIPSDVIHRLEPLGEPEPIRFDEAGALLV